MTNLQQNFKKSQDTVKHLPVHIVDKFFCHKILNITDYSNFLRCTSKLMKRFPRFNI